MSEFTEEICIREVEAMILNVELQVNYRENKWNNLEWCIAEHFIASVTAGATIYLCGRGYNIDFDARCECCGNMMALGSVDIVGSPHKEDEDFYKEMGDWNSFGRKVYAETQLKIAKNSKKQNEFDHTIKEAGEKIFKTLNGHYCDNCCSVDGALV